MTLALAFAAETAAVVVITGEPRPLLALVLHLAVAVAAARALGGARREERLFAGALVLTVPVAGLAALTAVRVAMRLLPAVEPGGEHATLASLPAPEGPAEPLDSVLEWLQGQLDVRPLADVVRGTDPAMQRWAVQLLAARDDALAVGLLREALNAADRDVQIAASAGLQRVDERLTTGITTARERVARTPEVDTAWVALGDAARAYVASSLLEPVMARHWLGEAVAAYRRALELRPDATDARLGLARALVGLGDLGAAEALTRTLLQEAPSSEADLVLAEILFQQRRWAELAEACRVSHGAGRSPELLAWWAGHEPTERAAGALPPAFT